MKEKLRKINDYEWLLPKSARQGMLVDAKLIANKVILDSAEDQAIEQLTNCACLPGIVEPVLGMPDIHWGYGEPMGAVSAFDGEEGIISVGMVGFDINCGITLIRTNLTVNDVKPKLKELMNELFAKVPCGVGSKGKLHLTKQQLDDVLVSGVDWAIQNGYGCKKDKKATEEEGKMANADPSKVSELAKKRGIPQLGTLGAGNHFLEVQQVSNIFDKDKAKKYGIDREGQITIMLHCGSRGLGHQVATDYLRIHAHAAKKYNIKLPDPQLVCAPVLSKEGQDYFKAMCCAVNYAFVNRLVMTQWIREAFAAVFKRSWEDMDMHTIYSICHNICKYEKHYLPGTKTQKWLYVHRKGATRSFPNMPVLIAGTMGTASYLLEGTEKAMHETFGSSCHGSGRVMSRHAAIKKFYGAEIKEKLHMKGEEIRSTHPEVLAEEAPLAYKDVDAVIDSVVGAGINLRIARMTPLGVAKG